MLGFSGSAMGVVGLGSGVGQKDGEGEGDGKGEVESIAVDVRNSVDDWIADDCVEVGSGMDEDEVGSGWCSVRVEGRGIA